MRVARPFTGWGVALCKTFRAPPYWYLSNPLYLLTAIIVAMAVAER